MCMYDVTYSNTCEYTRHKKFNLAILPVTIKFDDCTKPISSSLMPLQEKFPEWDKVTFSIMT